MYSTSFFVSGVSPDVAPETTNLALIRHMHLRLMGTTAAAPTLPTEELRNQIDGENVLPERRNFARTILLFESELRPTQPNASWETLRRGALVPPAMMRGMPTLVERVERRFYNEYCEPDFDFQPMWDSEEARIDSRTRSHEHAANMAFMSGCLLGTVAGTGALLLYASSLVIGPPSAPLLAAYAMVCFVSTAVFLHYRKQASRLG